MPFLFADVCQIIIIVLPIVSSYLLISSFVSSRNLIDKVNAVFLATCCQVILITEILSLGRWISGIGYLVSFSAVLLASLFTARLGGDRDRWQCIKEDVKNARAYADCLREQAARSPLLAFLLFLFFVSVFWRIFLILFVPPNNPDSLIYHLSRVAYWMQQGSLSHYYTHTTSQLSYAFGAEILCLWTMAFSSCDRLVGFVQFSCYLLLGTLVYRCVRTYLNVSVPSSVTVALLSYSLPLAVLESTSAQNDLVVAYFGVFALVYFLLGLSSNKSGYWFLSAVSLGVAVGVKTTIVFFIMPLAMVMAIAAVRRTVSLRKIGGWILIAALSFVAFSAYSYVQNYVSYRNFFGPKGEMAIYEVSPRSFQSFASTFCEHVFNLATSQNGIGSYAASLESAYNRFTANLGEAIFRMLHVSANAPGAFRLPFRFDAPEYKFGLSEDFAFFGPAGLVILLYGLYAVLKSRYYAFSLMFLGYLAAISYFMKWSPWSNRYLLTAIFCGIPLVSLIIEAKSAWVRALGSVLVGYSALLLIAATFGNELKPMRALGKDKIALRCLGHKDMEQVLKGFERIVPAKTTVATLLSAGTWDYPFFGERLERKVWPVNYSILRDIKADYLLVDRSLGDDKTMSDYITKTYEFVQVLGETEGRTYRLFRRIGLQG